MGFVGSQAHTLYVKRLYKRSLKLASDWYWQRAEFREKALIIRGLFEAHKSLTNYQEIEAQLGFMSNLTAAQAEHLLAQYHTTRPYILPHRFGGSSWERNVPVPDEMIERGVTKFE